MDQQAPQQAWHELPPSVGCLEQLSHAGRLPGQHVPCGESTQKIPVIRLFQMLSYFGGAALSDPSGAHRVPEIMCQCGVSCATYAGAFCKPPVRLLPVRQFVANLPCWKFLNKRGTCRWMTIHCGCCAVVCVCGSMPLFMTSFLSSFCLWRVVVAWQADHGGFRAAQVADSGHPGTCVDLAGVHIVCAAMSGLLCEDVVKFLNLLGKSTATADCMWDSGGLGPS